MILRNLRTGGSINILEFNKKSRVLQLGWNNSMHQYRLETNRLSISLAERTWVLLWMHWTWANSTWFLHIKPRVYWAAWERGLLAGGGNLLAPSSVHWCDYTWNTEPIAWSPLFREDVEKRELATLVLCKLSVKVERAKRKLRCTSRFYSSAVVQYQ